MSAGFCCYPALSLKILQNAAENSTIEKVRRRSEKRETQMREGKVEWLRLKISHRQRMSAP